MTDTSDPEIMRAPTAGLIVIGNEILSGRTQDINIHWIAEKMTSIGIRFTEVRIVPDIEDAIVQAVNEVRARVTYLFTTGGIGPTHDDITTDAIAKAFGKTVMLDPAARQMLVDYYGDENALNEPRLKMAHVPEGAKLIANPVSGAPGFQVENVYTLAGVPKIMQAMLDNIMAELKTGPKILSQTVTCNLGESSIALQLSEIQNRYPDVEIGSYPHYRAGELGLSLVLRSAAQDSLAAAADEVRKMVVAIGGVIKI